MDGAVSVWPAWEVREDGAAGDDAGVTSWWGVRLAFPDGAQVDLLAVVSDAGVCIEDVRAQPALSLDDLAVLAEWVEGPLSEVCGVEPAGRPGASRHARPAWPRGIAGQWLVAREYRAAQEKGVDPVLAVMGATGHGRRRSLSLIAQARDAGFLTARHARR
jgi:hypothetical protein